MGVDSYLLIASILLYIVMARSMDRRGFSAILCATVVTLGPLLFRIITSTIVLTGFNLPLSDLFNWSLLLTFVLQWVAAVFIFHKLTQFEDQLVGWMVWMFIGGILLYFTIPSVV